MRKRLPKTIIILVLVQFILVIVYLFNHEYSNLKESEVKVAQQSRQTTAHSQELRNSSKTYPNLSNYDQLEIKVSIAKQKMSILSENKVIFSTTVSTGASESPTPPGNFVIESERGDFFYNATSGEGAYYWVSFKDHGIYLFHSVPTDENGNEIPQEAEKLGQACSHGCVRMSREDAKWFYENIPEGIAVQIS